MATSTNTSVSSKTAAKRGSKFTPARPKYRGRSTKTIRAQQNALRMIKGRDLTSEEKGALYNLSTPLTRENGGGR